MRNTGGPDNGPVWSSATPLSSPVHTGLQHVWFTTGGSTQTVEGDWSAPIQLMLHRSSTRGPVDVLIHTSGEADYDADYAITGLQSASGGDLVVHFPDNITEVPLSLTAGEDGTYEDTEAFDLTIADGQTDYVPYPQTSSTSPTGAISVHGVIADPMNAGPTFNIYGDGPMGANEGDTTFVALRPGQVNVDHWIVHWGNIAQEVDAKYAYAAYIWPDNAPSAVPITVDAVRPGGSTLTAKYYNSPMDTNPSMVIFNADPMIQPTAAQTISIGEVASLAVAFHDPGYADSHTGTINWGDGTVEDAQITETPGDGAGSAYGSHVYAAAGQYTPTLTLTDDDGGTSAVAMGQITVASAAPTITPLPIRTIDEGSEVYYSIPFHDNDRFDAHTATINWGDGTPVETVTPDEFDGDGVIFVKHLYTQNAILVPGSGQLEAYFNVTLRVTDQSGQYAQTTQRLNVLNVAPKPDWEQVWRIPLGDSIDLSGAFTDPGIYDTHTYAWVVRDAASAIVGTASTQDLTFTPGALGTYVATYTVYDSDGGEGNGQQIIIVTDPNAPPNTTPPDAPTNATVTSVYPEGVSLSWTGVSGDIDGYEIEWSDDNQEYDVIAIVSPSSTSYVDRYPFFNEYNYYRVRAYQGDLESTPASFSPAKPITEPVSVDDDNGGANDRGTLSPFATLHDQPLTGNVFGNDRDLSGLGVTISGFTQPEHGTLVLNNDGSFTFTPHYHYVGTVTFTYTATNGQQTARPATVNIDVTNQEPIPAQVGQDYFVPDISSNGEPVEGDVLGGDPDGEPIYVYTILTNPRNGSVNLNPNTGHYTYTPNQGATGEDGFTYTVSDGIATSYPGGVRITNTYDGPTPPPGNTAPPPTGPKYTPPPQPDAPPPEVRPKVYEATYDGLEKALNAADEALRKLLKAIDLLGYRTKVVKLDADDPTSTPEELDDLGRQAIE